MPGPAARVIQTVSTVRAVTPDGGLGSARPWSQGELARVIQHKLISSSQSSLAPCQGQEPGPLMGDIGSFFLHGFASKMQMQTSQPTPRSCAPRERPLVPMTGTHRTEETYRAFVPS